MVRYSRAISVEKGTTISPHIHSRSCWRQKTSGAIMFHVWLVHSQTDGITSVRMKLRHLKWASQCPFSLTHTHEPFSSQCNPFSTTTNGSFVAERLIADGRQEGNDFPCPCTDYIVLQSLILCFTPFVSHSTTLESQHN